MNFFSKLERKFGKYAISNISLYLIMCYAVGYMLVLLHLDGIFGLLTLDPYAILHGQIWRIVTWIIVPPGYSPMGGYSVSFFILITLYFYYSIGRSLEAVWGTFNYNLFLFSGMFFTVIGSFVLMGILSVANGSAGNPLPLSTLTGIYAFQFSTYYVNMSIFLGYAATFPDAQVLLMFIIPIKVKVLGILYAVLLGYQFLITDISGKIVIGASLLNFVVFFTLSRNRFHMSPKHMKRRHDFKREIKHAQPKGITRHKCAICGRTEETNPELEFRFCSKCNGNYEYCQEHLFTHTHVK